jgi:hypothetical protein
LLIAGTLAAIDPSVPSHIDPLWSALLAVGTLVAVVFAVRAPRPLRSGGLKLDLVFLGGTLFAGSTVETAHAVGILDATAYHAALAAAIGIPAALLLGLEGRPFPVEMRVVWMLRVAAFMLVLAAAGMFFALGFGVHREDVLGVAPMIVLAVAGLAFTRAGTRTPPLGWHRL